MHYACSVQARRLHMDAHNVYLCIYVAVSEMLRQPRVVTRLLARVLPRKMLRDDDLETMNYRLLRSFHPTSFLFLPILGTCLSDMNANRWTEKYVSPPQLKILSFPSIRYLFVPFAAATQRNTNATDLRGISNDFVR